MDTNSESDSVDEVSTRSLFGSQLPTSFTATDLWPVDPPESSRPLPGRMRRLAAARVPAMVTAALILFGLAVGFAIGNVTANDGPSSDDGSITATDDTNEGTSTTGPTGSTAADTAAADDRCVAALQDPDFILAFRDCTAAQYERLRSTIAPQRVPLRDACAMPLDQPICDALTADGN